MYTLHSHPGAKKESKVIKKCVCNLREFACYTTVILAQPRVSRLRAGVVYVAFAGPAGPAERTLDPGFSNAGFARTPPEIAPTLRGI